MILRFHGWYFCIPWLPATGYFRLLQLVYTDWTVVFYCSDLRWNWFGFPYPAFSVMLFFSNKSTWNFRFLPALRQAEQVFALFSMSARMFGHLNNAALLHILLIRDVRSVGRWVRRSVVSSPQLFYRPPVLCPSGVWVSWPQICIHWGFGWSCCLQCSSFILSGRDRRMSLALMSLSRAWSPTRLLWRCLPAACFWWLFALLPCFIWTKWTAMSSMGPSR